jgi:hypothetical protein
MGVLTGVIWAMLAVSPRTKLLKITNNAVVIYAQLNELIEVMR